MRWQKARHSRSSEEQMCKYSFTLGLTLQFSVFAFCCRNYLLSHPYHGHNSSFTLVLFLIKLRILLRSLHFCPNFWNLLICKWMRCYPNIPKIGSNHQNDSSFLCITVTNTKKKFFPAFLLSSIPFLVVTCLHKIFSLVEENYFQHLQSRRTAIFVPSLFVVFDTKEFGILHAVGEHVKQDA